MKHPLKNPKAKHYEDATGSHIEKAESFMTVAGTVAMCEFMISKYEFRKNKKGQRELDEEKTIDYRAYKEALVPLLFKGYKNHTVEHAYELEKIKYDSI